MASRDSTGMPPIEHVGFRAHPFSDFYHSILSMTWPVLLLVLAIAYFGFNAVFAALYMFGGDCYGATDPGSTLEAFSFSVQTMSGIGYGAMSPTTRYAHYVSIAEAFLGLLGIALTTGMLFAKFSRPDARVGFSNHAVINEMNGQPMLQLRMSNLRRNQVVDARVVLVALLDHVSQEGQRMRKAIDLELVRPSTPVFMLSWTIMHPIDPNSPLYGLTEANKGEQIIGLIVNFTGIDDTFSQTVHAQRFYHPPDIRVNHSYRDMIETLDDGSLRLHHDRLHDIEPVSKYEPAPEDP